MNQAHNFKDLTGNQYGRLLVISLAGRNKHGHTVWKCKCECGNYTNVARPNLQSGGTIRCDICGRVQQSESKTKDISGQKFGRWTVLIKSNKRNAKGQFWKCRCECGNIKIINGCLLRSGNSKSCGCYRNDQVRKAIFDDLTGQKFNFLTVQIFDIIKNGETFWKCKCDCGKVISVRAPALKNGNTKSCGCWKTIHLCDIKSLKLEGKRFGRLIVISRCGSNKRNQSKWNCLCDCGNKSIVTGSELTSGKTLSCGCYNKDRIVETHSYKLIGKQFGRLMVLEKINSGNPGCWWKCQCRCGKFTIASSNSLCMGTIKSCGCLQSDNARMISDTENSKSWIRMWQQVHWQEKQRNKL